MAIKSRIDPIERDIQVIIDQELSPEARAKRFAEDVQATLADTDEINRQALGRVPRNRTWVNGREGASLESAGPAGTVVREYDLTIEVLFAIADMLRQASPIGRGSDKRAGHPGFYRDSHILFADGQQVKLDASLAAAAEYIFLSTAAYARRVERRHDVYELVAAKAQRRYGNVVKINFSWVSPLITKYIPGAQNREQRALERRAQPRAKWAAMSIERNSRVPAIIVTLGPWSSWAKDTSYTR